MNSFAQRLLALDPAPPQRRIGRRATRWRDYDLFGAVPFVAVHLGALGALWTGASWQVWMVCAVLFWGRMFAATGIYHRYFSHRTYKTSRPMQFLLAVVAQTTSQKGVLWWAAHHRAHHRNSDSPRDVHSPRQFGFWHAHVGWIYDGTTATDYSRVRDLTRFPELVILNKLWWMPPAMLGAAVWAIWGWSGLWVGFMLSTVLVWHATFTINSLAHVWGGRRYDTPDTSRNNWVLALLTMGEGWHNNHHYFMGSARQGFYWWEVDATYYVLRAMSWVGLVWDLKPPPARVYEARARLPGSDPIPADTK